MISIALLVSAVLTLATSQVAAAPSPQVVGTPEAVDIFFSDCATNSQVLQPTDSTCYTFAFNGVNQAFLAPGFTAIVYSAAGCTGSAIQIAQSPPLGGCHIVTGSQSYQVVAA